MLPHIHIGFFSIPSYSLMILLGLIAFTVVSIGILEKREGVPQRVTNRLLILSAVGFGVMALGAFLLNSLFHSIERGAIAFGGITWLGGVLCAFPAMIALIHWFCPFARGEALEYFNLLLPGVVLAHGIGRVGCFLGGCCYGAPTDSVLGVSFPEGSFAAREFPSPTGGSLPVLPTQLIEAAFEFALFLLMLLLYRRLKRHFLELFALSYGLFRFLLEFLRGDDRGVTGISVTPSQLMSVVLWIGAILLILYHRGLILKGFRDRMAELAEQRDPLALYGDREAAKRLRELKWLADDGVISEEEFERAKAELLRRLTEDPHPSK